jgi:O-antigen/teichoic acid export membrane protein
LIQKIKLVLADAEHRHTAMNAILALGIRILGAGMAFIFNLIIARQLGAEQTGYFFLAFSLVMFLSAFTCLGFENTVLRFTSEYVKQGAAVKAILNFALQKIMPLACLIAFLLYFLAEPLATNGFNKPHLADVFKMISPAIIGFSVVLVVAMSLQARHKLLAAIPCQNIAHLFLCSGFVLFLTLDTAQDIALYLSLSLGISSSFFYWYSLRGLDNQGTRPNNTQLWQSARPNWVITLMTQTLQWFAPIMIGIWLLAEDGAYFSVAQRIAMLTSFILMAINLVVAPKFAAFKAADDMDNIRKTALFSVRLLLISALPIISFMLVFPSFLMGLFGDDFKQGALLLQILVLGQAVNVITGSVGYLLTMSGNERDMRFVTIFSCITVVVLTCTLTPLYGAVGAAVATAFSLAMQNLMAVYFVKKRLGFNTLKFWQEI